MKVPDQFKEYIWLLNTIQHAREITFEEIQDKWVRSPLSGGVEMAKSSFHRHKDAILDIFGIEIDCDKKRGFRYFIRNSSVLKEDTVQNWLLSTLTVGNIVSEGIGLQERILLEQVPCDDFIQVIIDAMKSKVRIEVDYQKYGADHLSHADFEPYCIKLFKQRWYVLGHFYRAATEDKPESNYFALYSLDRMKKVALTKTKFEVDPEFNAKAYFEDSYGVIVGGNVPVQEVVLRVFGVQRFYLHDLPLHKSQREVGSGEDYTDFAYDIRPTVDFKGHIMSLGKSVRVLKPQTLADDIKTQLSEALEQYL